MLVLIFKALHGFRSDYMRQYLLCYEPTLSLTPSGEVHLKLFPSLIWQSDKWDKEVLVIFLVMEYMPCGFTFGSPLSVFRKNAPVQRFQ